MDAKKLFQGAVTTGAGTTCYTAPSGYKARVSDIDIANTTAAALAITIHLVPVGASAAAANMLFPAVVVPANTLIQWTGNQLLGTGDYIKGIGSGAGITLAISGEEGRQ